MPLEPGATGSATLDIKPEHSARLLGSGELDVLGTPAVIALCESATLDGLSGRVPASSTTVGTRVDVRHRAPSPIGATVTAYAELVAVDGDRLTFSVSATCNDVPIASGTIERVIVDRTSFLDRVASA